jgi:DNA-binding beta-propeller fold protein YncE
VKVLLLLVLPLVAAAAGGSAVVAKVPVPGTPCGVAGAAGAVWVTDPLFGRLVRIDPASNTVTMKVATDPTPCELRSAAGSLWVITQSGRLDRFDPKTGKRLASIKVGATTYDVAYAAQSIWITNRNGGTVQRISPASNRVLKTVRFPAGVAPAGIGWAAGALWVGDDYGRSVFRLDPRTYRFTRVASGGQAASWIAVNGTDIWVSNTKSGSVTRIDAVRRKGGRDRQDRDEPRQPGCDRRRRLGA